MRYTESGDPITYFQRSSSNSNTIHCMCYNCTSLESIPDFMWIFNPALLYFGTISSVRTEGYNRGAFQNCTSLTSIPSHLFYNLHNLLYLGGNTSWSGTSSSSRDAYGIFQGCTGLTELPDGLFSHLPKLTHGCPYTTGTSTRSWCGVFYNCTGLVKVGKIFKNLPAMLYMSLAYDYSGMFNNCTSLEEVPEDLFENLPSLLYVPQTFYNCASLTTSTLSFKGTPNVSLVTNFVLGGALEYYTIQAESGSTTASSFSALTNVTVEEI